MALFATASLAAGQGLEHKTVTPAAGTSTQRFGYALAVEGDVMVAGAPFEDTNATNAGAAFVFRWDPVAGDWMEEQELFPSDPEALARFGSVVAISGDAIVVGAPLEDNANGTDAGAVYVFRFDAVAGSWSEEQKLIEPGGAAAYWFGNSVAISGDGLVVGVPNCYTTGPNGGCAYVYRWLGSSSGWAVDVMLEDPLAGRGERAGSVVAIENDLVLVASPTSDKAGVQNAGSVAVWRKNGSVWSYDQELTSSHKTTDDRFGLSLAVRNGLVMVGAPLEDLSVALADSGAAYVFRHDGTAYVEESRFTHPSPASGQRFGVDVDIDGDLAVVGALYDDTAANDAGGVFTFRRARNAWAFDQPLGASDAAANDRLGGQVALNGFQILAGADGNDTAAGTDWGVVYGYLAAEMNLEITPSAPAPGALVTFTAFHGTPNDIVLTALTEVNGSFFFLPVFTDVFAGDHAWTLAGNAPNPLLGVHLGFRSFKFSEAGPIVASDTAYVDI
jgi:hypothetical protein